MKAHGIKDMSFLSNSVFSWVKTGRIENGGEKNMRKNGTTRTFSPKFGVILGEKMERRVVDKKILNLPSLHFGYVLNVVLILVPFSLFLFKCFFSFNQIFDFPFSFLNQWWLFFSFNQMVGFTSNCSYIYIGKFRHWLIELTSFKSKQTSIVSQNHAQQNSK